MTLSAISGRARSTSPPEDGPTIAAATKTARTRPARARIARAHEEKSSSTGNELHLPKLATAPVVGSADAAAAFKRRPTESMTVAFSFAREVPGHGETSRRKHPPSSPAREGSEAPDAHGAIGP